jgi:hypothetical protein
MITIIILNSMICINIFETSRLEIPKDANSQLRMIIIIDIIAEIRSGNNGKTSQVSDETLVLSRIRIR